MNHKVLIRLERIKGQVEGIIKMCKDDRECTEIVAQIAAARSALGEAGKMILSDEAVSCSQTNKHDKLEGILKQLFKIT